MAKLVGKWVFEVLQDPQTGTVSTKWSVITDDESEYGEAQGALHNGILAAYDGMGLVSPLLLDNDLLYLSGFETEEEVNE